MMARVLMEFWRYIGSEPGRGILHVVIFSERFGIETEIVTISAAGAWMGPVEKFYEEFVRA